VLRHWWERIRRRRPVAASAVNTGGWATLCAVLDEAVALQPDADEAIASCGRHDDATGDVARRAADLAGAYLALRRRLPAGAADAHLATRVAAADPLLQTHQWLLTEAVHLRFSVAPNARRAAFARRFTGLGAAGPALARLRQRVRGEMPADPSAGP
jgi:hypothetical protein